MQFTHYRGRDITGHCFPSNQCSYIAVYYSTICTALFERFVHVYLDNVGLLCLRAIDTLRWPLLDAPTGLILPV